MNDLKRYVLTNDNKIIDFKGWTTTVNGVDMPLNHISRIRHILGTVRTDATYEDYLHTIKVQSDNVFDLIEVGDLIKVDEKTRHKSSKNYYSIYKVDLVEEDLEDDECLIHANGWVWNTSIISIYKPNSRGDYIKVWEVEENVDTITR